MSTQDNDIRGQDNTSSLSISVRDNVIKLKSTKQKVPGANTKNMAGQNTHYGQFAKKSDAPNDSTTSLIDDKKNGKKMNNGLMTQA